MRNVFLYILGLTLSLLSHPASAQDVEIVSVTPITDEDLQKIEVLEKGFFADMMANGTFETVKKLSPTIKNDAMEGQIKLLDDICRPVEEIRRVKTASFGGLVYKSTYLVTQGPCLIVWDLAFAKIGGNWKINWMNFNSIDLMLRDKNWP